MCPSCNARRMADVGAYLSDHVLPLVVVIGREDVSSATKPSATDDPCAAAGPPPPPAAPDPPTVEAILLHLDLPHRPPPVAPARGPPQAELTFDQTPEFEPEDAEPVPDFEFDQSRPEDWDA